MSTPAEPSNDQHTPTDPTPPADLPDNDAHGADEDTGHPDGDPAGSGKDNPAREAARYRTQLRAAEAERDSLAERVRTYQRHEVAVSTLGILDVPDDLFEVGNVALDDLLTDGEVDPAKVEQAAAALAEQRPRLAPQQRRVDLGQGNRSTVGAVTSWADVLRR